MKLKIFIWALATNLCVLSVAVSQAQTTRPAESVSLDQQIAALAKDLAKQLLDKRSDLVTALDFTDMQKRPNELGVYLAAKLSIELDHQSGLTVLDRANFASIMKEYNLTTEGLMENPSDAKKLGQFKGVKALLVGKLISLDGNIELLATGISTDTAAYVASGTISFPATEDLQRMLGQSAVLNSSLMRQEPDRTTAAGKAIAEKQVGPVTIILKDVMKHSIKRSYKMIPAIRCTFDVENRNLGRLISIAVNRRLDSEFVYEFRPGSYRGTIVDSSRMNWSPIETSGISAITCFDLDGDRKHLQLNPSGAVKYIQKGTLYDAKEFRKGMTGMFWAGSFSSIPTSERMELTVDFIPAAMTEKSGVDAWSNEGELWKWPEFFQLDMELVVGTFVEGEDPLKAKDLMLRNFRIDRVNLPMDVKVSKP